MGWKEFQQYQKGLTDAQKVFNKIKKGIKTASPYVIGLIPATDNRPSGNAYAPGDVITMHNGKTVEVLNTDAEGRLIMADALAYAAESKPDLICDVATLTGASYVALGLDIGAVFSNSKKMEENLIKVIRAQNML